MSRRAGLLKQQRVFALKGNRFFAPKKKSKKLQKKPIPKKFPDRSAKLKDSSESKGGRIDNMVRNNVDCHLCNMQHSTSGKCEWKYQRPYIREYFVIWGCKERSTTAARTQRAENRAAARELKNAKSYEREESDDEGWSKDDIKQIVVEKGGRPARMRGGKMHLLQV